MEFTGERFVLGATDIELEIEHLNRYHFATQFVEGKNVLDAACGTGYGCAILAHNAQKVTGIDISEESVDYAAQRYGGDNISFQRASIESIPYPESTFDVVVSFETLEHVDELAQGQFMREIRRVLKPDGLLIMSTPNHSVYSKRGVNEFHIKELTDMEFSCLLEAQFRYVYIFSQQWEVCNVIIGDRLGAAVSGNGLPLEQAEYMIAVCSNAQIDSIVSRIVVRSDRKLEKLMAWAMENHYRNEKNNAHISQLEETLKQCMDELKSQSGHVELLLHSERELQAELSAEKKAHMECVHMAEKKDAEYRHMATEKDMQYQSLKAEQARRYQNFEKKTSQKYQELIALSEAKEAQWQEAARNQEEHIAMLLGSDRELARIQASRSWRFMKRVWKIRDVFVPKGSRRRLFGKAMIQFVKHPIRFVSKCTPERAGKFFRYLRTEGVESVSGRMDRCLFGQELELRHQMLQLEEVSAKGAALTFDDYEKIRVPQWEKPLVSIIIPVYNQFDYTYNCVKSIVKNSGAITYEILIADDCSTDLTTRIGEIVEGLVLIVNPENLRFLRNCNNASKVARGKYVLFLNNDTQVQENWLEPLVKLIEQDGRVGLVGSKLIYPDGRLQEAGGIFWRDGSAWNYGNQSDPALPEYNYVKEVDYISGASIMLPRKLWEKIGGFDERFAPAYYEDCDLAFTVRQMGYKVMYQPLSVVVHFEGISNGKDITSGQKKHQVVNEVKFYEKWQDILERDHFDNGTAVFVARDRSRYKKTIVVVDHYIPTFDQDTGSRTIYQYLKLLVEIGYSVKLIPDNFYHDPKYATVYEQLGIEILYGPYYVNNWKRWLKENSPYIQHVLLCRPHISIKYIDFIRKNMNVKLTYFGVDLQYLREMREYELTGDAGLKRSAEKWEKIEYQLMEEADISLTLSVYEKEIIAPRIGADKAWISPVFFYTKEEIERQTMTLGNRAGLLFVGGFNHHPNVDGVLWFVREVLGKVREAIPECTFYIVGSHPTAEVLAVADEHVVVTGFVSDEELEEYYKRARVVVIPLRYGAGVKGKTIEAMYHGVPIVSTSTGTEGLENIESYVPCVDDAEGFAQRVIELYQKTDAQMEEIHDTYMRYINKHYSYESAKALFERIFD